MKIRLMTGMVAVVVISSVSLVGTGGLINAQQASRDRQHPPQQQRDKKRQKRQQPRVAVEPQSPPRVAAKPQRLPQERQQRLIEQQRDRSTAYREHLQAQERLAEQRAQALRQERRLAQYRYQQRYLERLRQQRTYLVRYEPSYPYNRDPYFYTAPTYRYARAGSYYETNRYGADLLRQAVNYGYEEGFRAGQADRQDRWGNGYEDSFAYQDANYGFRGYYVDQSEYNYYFREGFRRGYEDGYNSRYQYGRRSNGRYVVLTSILAGILVLEALTND